MNKKMSKIIAIGLAILMAGSVCTAALVAFIH